jgi:pSer/pThr/pTyr-binding forkhead associated (FHA) protein
MEIITRKMVVLSSVARGASFLLTGIQAGIGRDDDNAICLEDDLISRHHAVLIRQNGEYLLRDLNSLNGTFLNGEPARETPLKLGDRIRIGEVEMGYEAVTVSSPAVVPERTEKSAGEPTTDLKSVRRATGAPKKSDRSVSVGDASALDEIRQAAEQIATLTKENRELVTRLFALEARCQSANAESAEIRRLETELAQARNAAQRVTLFSPESRHASEAEMRERSQELVAKLEAIEVGLEKVRLLIGSDRPSEAAQAVGELVRIRTALKTVAEWRSSAVRLSKENEELRKVLGTAHEEIAVARRCLSDRTTEEFVRIRQSMIEKNAVAEPRGMLGHLSAARRVLHLT